MQSIPLAVLKQRFWRKVELSADGCWYWVGGHTKQGYGRFWDGNKKVLSNRFLYEITVGPIPEGMLLCHTCDHPACVNPEHQFTGTTQDNMDDMKLKGRKNGRPSLVKTNNLIKKTGRPSCVALEVADAIRAKYNGMWGAQTALAKEYGLNRNVVWYLLRQVNRKAEVA